MAKVCYCADDFAMNAEISDAIIQLIEQGALQATSCMTQSDLWETAAAKLKPFSDRVDIGLHLNLTHTFASGNLVFPLPMLIVRAWSASEPYRVCRRVNILRDYPDDKTKLYPR
ncbi:ChbG/HpnK family deacetylase, partial [Acinetobacter baumannii]|uniref:ChbG/HpnK family deacetylase n=1 Tax=Acinetobacter baumannii TaxID=470 RepID=UPI00209AC115